MACSLCPRLRAWVPPGVCVEFGPRLASAPQLEDAPGRGGANAVMNSVGSPPLLREPGSDRPRAAPPWREGRWRHVAVSAFQPSPGSAGLRPAAPRVPRPRQTCRGGAATAPAGEIQSRRAPREAESSAVGRPPRAASIAGAHEGTALFSERSAAPGCKHGHPQGLALGPAARWAPTQAQSPAAGGTFPSVLPCGCTTHCCGHGQQARVPPNANASGFFGCSPAPSSLPPPASESGGSPRRHQSAVAFGSVWVPPWPCTGVPGVRSASGPDPWAWPCLAREPCCSGIPRFQPCQGSSGAIPAPSAAPWVPAALASQAQHPAPTLGLCIRPSDLMVSSKWQVLGSFLCFREWVLSGAGARHITTVARIAIKLGVRSLGTACCVVQVIPLQNQSTGLENWHPRVIKELAEASDSFVAQVRRYGDLGDSMRLYRARPVLPVYLTREELERAPCCARHPAWLNKWKG